MSEIENEGGNPEEGASSTAAADDAAGVGQGDAGNEITREQAAVLASMAASIAEPGDPAVDPVSPNPAMPAAMGDEPVEPSKGEIVESVSDLFRSAIAMPLEMKGYKCAAKLWNEELADKMASPTVKTLNNYEYGRKFLGWLAGGGPGASELSLFGAAYFCYEATKAAIAEDAMRMQAEAAGQPSAQT